MQENRPERLVVNGGIGGADTKTFMLLVEAKPGKVTLTYDGLKVGKHSTTITLP
jgi:hypothetical protein